MLNTPEVKKIYQEIQKKLFYMVPEKWESLFLYASITDKAYQMPIGEMYFYYFPKGILKKNPVNVYQIPAKFNIDDSEYMKLVKNLYLSIDRLRQEYKNNNHKLWTNITISMENFKFKIEYKYDELEASEDANFVRHVIWRYKYLKMDKDLLNRKERKIIEQYEADNNDNLDSIETYEEALYKKPVHNIFEYNKMEKDKKEKTNVMEKIEEEYKTANNQILAGFNSKKEE